MNILVVNYRYFVSGGPERYMFGIIEQLERRGHKVVPFSIAYRENLETPYAKYFAAPIGGPEGAWYKNLKLTHREKLRLAMQVLYNTEAKEKIKRALREERIDLVYALQMVNRLYPSVVDGCHEAGVPVVHRLSDFQYLCANYKFFRDGRVCELCLKGAYYHGVVHRCMKGSLSVSGTRVLSMYFDRLRGTRHRIAAFVAPSRIVIEKMIAGGFDPAKMHHIPTFVDASDKAPDYNPGGYFLYAGAIDPFKGVRVLLEAFATMRGGGSTRLVIAGYSLGDEEERLKAEVQQRAIAGVEFPGFQQGEALAKLYRGARCVVMPTLWYENMPNVVLEAMAYGKPVIGSDLGGVAEVIKDGKDGLLFKPGDAASLRDRLEETAADDGLVRRMGMAAREKVVSEYAPDNHCDRLLAVFDEVARSAAGMRSAS
jgi:glycosyltransferase involved in cell wall biosynthesis